MSKLGDILKEAREAKKLSLSDVYQATRITVVFLEKMEDGNFYDLPSYAHAHGFFIKYVQYLELPLDELKPVFEEECSKENFSQFERNIVNDIGKEQYKKSFPYLKILLLLLIIILAVSAYFYVNYINRNGKEPVKNTQLNSIENKSASNVMMTDNLSDNATKDSGLIDNTTDNTSNLTDNKTDNISIQKDINKNDNITENLAPATVEKKSKNLKKTVVEKNTAKLNEVKIEFNDICWVHINIDNKKNLDFIAEKNSVRKIKFKEFFIIDIGNAAAVKIFHGKEKYGKFGKYRQPVKHLKFTINKEGKLVYTKIK